MAWESLTKQSPIKGEIMVAVPYKKDFSAKFVSGLISLEYPAYYHHSVYFQTGQPVDVARNIMVSNALQRNVSHIFFVDQDIVLKTDTLQQLIDTRMPFVSGVYFNRAAPYGAVANINGSPVSRDEIVNRLEKATNHKALMEVHEVGMGCCLIDIRVFKRIAINNENMEWICMLRHPDSLQSIEKDDTMVSYTTKEAITLDYKCKYCGNTLVAPFFDYRIGKYSTDALSEDYYFCKRARKVGFNLYVALHAIVQHEITTFLIDETGLINTTMNAGVVN